MAKVLYDNIVSRIALVVPMFAKSIVDSSFAECGINPYEAAPSQIRKILDTVIFPRLKSYTKSTDAASLLTTLGTGQIIVSKEGRVTFISIMAQKLTGLKTTDSFAGKNTEDSLDLKIVLDEILSLKKEVVIETRSLSRQSVNIICGALKDRLGEVYGAVLFLQDTTLQSAFEKEMNTVYDRLEEKSRELEQKNITLLESQAKLLQSEKMAAVGQLASGVAHEINNPLGIILGFAQSVVKRLKDADPLTMPLKTIEREAMRCKNLVQDLLIFSRASGSAPRDDIDLNETVETTLPLLLDQTKMSGIKFIKEPGTGIPRIQANKAQLQQVLINLAGNAIDAMPDGGTLTVTTSLSRKLPNHVELRVQDTGSGIPKDIQKNIFEPFFTTKEIGKGTGLGLSLIYEIVRKHGGTIEVESEEGKGAVFTIALPVRPAARRSTGNSDA